MPRTYALWRLPRTASGADRYGLLVRLLFVSGTITGGSGRSQRELAARLALRGHEVLFLVDDELPARVRHFVYENLADLAVLVGDRPGARLVRFIERQPGRRTRSTQMNGVDHLITPVPENAAPGVIESFQPDVVVANSVLRLTWRKVHELCEQRGIATVLYVREVAAMNHFTLGVQPAHRIVANAQSLASAVEQLGYPCSVLPSVIEIGVTRVSPHRLAALVINPIASHGIDIVWRLARELPEVTFVIQQSWPLSDAEFAVLQRTAETLPNVELRRAAPAGASLYADARVLLVPHRIDNRPRVVAEAQANGIPVIASNKPGLVEAVGTGGLIIDLDDLQGWVTALRLLWTDDDEYDRLMTRAISHSQRPEIDPEHITAAFESLIEEAVAAAGRDIA